MENRFERWRQKLSKSVNLNTIYTNINKENKDFIIEEDVKFLSHKQLKKYLDFHRTNFERKCLGYFFRVLDVKLRGKITFEEVN